MEQTSIRDLTLRLESASRMGTSLEAVDSVLGEALDAVGRIVPFDLAAVLELRGDELQVRVARGALASDRVRAHRLRLDAFPSVRRALVSGRAVAFAEQDHAHGDGDPYDGVLDLPHGHHCMVVPLSGTRGPIGVMTFDRAECGRYPTAVVELAEVIGRLVALAMSYGEQTAALTRLRDQLTEQNRVLREHVDGPTAASELLADGTSPAMTHIVGLARRVAATTTPVLITGETGTGKELVARAIHEWSDRNAHPLLSLNCSVLPAGLVESELFGHVKGAFSGATANRLGRFVAAHEGTLFLDEIGDLPLELQAKLLRVLQEGTFEPVGSDRTVRVDVRVVAATNADLREAVRTRRFREDLYFRLAVFPIELPPLRERRADIVPIAERFLLRLAQRQRRDPWRLTDAARERLRDAAWPGNVRELLNTLERATVLATSRELGAELFQVGRPVAAAASASSMEAMERDHIERTLARTNGRIYGAGGAAELLALHPSTLRTRMEKLGLGGARAFRKRAGG